MPLKNFISCSTPKGPPSWDAPLSASTTSSVFVQLTEPAQPVDEATDLHVGVVEERGEGLLQPGGQPLLVLGQLVPRLDAGVARRQLGALGDHAELELAAEPPLAHHVPALVEATPVLGQVLRRRLVGCVGGTEGQVGEEGPVGPDALAVGDHAQRLVDQVLGQVVPVAGTVPSRVARRVDRVVVGHQLGVELVGLALEEPVEAVEAPGQWPLVERAGGRALLHRREVPLADAEGGVAGVVEDLGHGGGVVGDVAELVREPGAEVRHRPHAHGVWSPTREQRGPGGRAQRRDVEVGVLQTGGGEGVDVRRVDVGAVAAELGEPGVVEQHDHHVGGILPRVGRLVEPRLRVGDRSPDPPVELPCSHRTPPFIGTDPSEHLRVEVSITNASTTRNRCGTVLD